MQKGPDLGKNDVVYAAQIDPECYWKLPLRADFEEDKPYQIDVQTAMGIRHDFESIENDLPSSICCVHSNMNRYMVRFKRARGIPQ
jgi:hypothetical protein